MRASCTARGLGSAAADKDDGERGAVQERTPALPTGVAVEAAREELLARLSSILELVDRNLVRLDAHRAYWRRLDEAHPNRVGRLEDKVASEACLLLLLVRRVGAELPPGVCALLDRIAVRLGPLVRNDRFRSEILRNPERAASFGLGHLYLTAAGYADEAWDQIVVPPLRDGFAETRDLPPHRILERLWARELAGIPLDEARAREAARLSIVAGKAHPVLMSHDDAYAYTHCLMYSTDFGCRSVDGFFDRAHVGPVVGACIAWALVEPDFDLLAEFLLCQTFLDPPWSDQASFAWRTLCAVSDRLGFVPGPTFDEVEFSALGGDDRRAYAFKELYHANVVVGALCASLLRAPALAVSPGRRHGAGSSGPHRREADLLHAALAHCRTVRGLGDDQTAPWGLAALEEGLDVAAARTLLEAAAIHAVRAGRVDVARAAAQHLRESGLAEETLAAASDHLPRLERLDSYPDPAMSG